MLEAWYSPREIFFTREQMLWLLEHLPELETGNWPVNPQGSGYVDLPLKKSGRQQAYFETPCQFAAEVSWRLDKTGEDGKILYWQVQSGVTEYELLEHEAKEALNYMSGWRRRQTSYSRFNTNRRYREKMRRFGGRQQLTKIQIQERKKRKRNARR